MDPSCAFCDPVQADFSWRTLYADANSVVVPTLGQLTPDGGYCLVVPKAHATCVASMDTDQTRALEHTVDRVAGALRRAYGVAATAFEHGIAGQSVPHAHVHVLPGTFCFSETLQRRFPTAEIDGLNTLQGLSCYRSWKDEPYLAWRTYGDPFWTVCWDVSVEPGVLRALAANALGVPKRADWKTVDRAADTVRILATRDLLAPLMREPCTACSPCPGRRP